jgi:predicted enzyme related to lactoylglutathione lyase
MSLLKQIEVVSYNVTNWEQAKEFYGKTLELPISMVSDDFGWCQFGVQGQANFAISRWNGPEPMPPTTGGGTVIFGVDDAYATVAELRRRGVKCDDVIPVPGMVTYAQFYDPEGNQLQIAGPAPKM